MLRDLVFAERETAQPDNTNETLKFLKKRLRNLERKQKMAWTHLLKDWLDLSLNWGSRQINALNLVFLMMKLSYQYVVPSWLLYNA